MSDKIERTEDGQFKVQLENGKTETVGTFSEAEALLEANDHEPAASQITPEEAEEINSDVRQHGDVSDPTEKQPSELKDTGAGNREAPHQTKTTANDPKNEKGRAN